MRQWIGYYKYECSVVFLGLIVVCIINFTSIIPRRYYVGLSLFVAFFMIILPAVISLARLNYDKPWEK